MYIVNPDPYLLPTYRISPFRTSDIALNLGLKEDCSILDYFDERFGNDRYTITMNGRQAIQLALEQYNLGEDDVVTIVTTTGNCYISSCVTTEIEKYCKWSRNFEVKTRLIFVNHEFGFPYTGLQELRSHNLPIIEDCAHSFFSDDRAHTTGKTGDYIIYSFPKMFPIQIGGLLVNNKDDKPFRALITEKEKIYIQKVLSANIKQQDVIIKSRINNYKYLENRFKSLNFFPRFHLDLISLPGVFMFGTEGHTLDLAELKKYYNAHGIQCSVFYGEEAFFIPVHQALKEEDLDYFVEVFRHFINM